MSKHTPGPWYWRSGNHGVDLMAAVPGQLVVMSAYRSGMQGADFAFSDRNGELRGGILENAKGLDLDRHPDARLIAAAPDLYHACEIALAFVEDMIEQTDSPEIPQGFGAIRDCIGAALLKADAPGPHLIEAGGKSVQGD